MSDPADRPFQTIARENTATPLLRLADRIGTRIAPHRSRRLRAQLGAAVLSAVSVPVLGAEVATGYTSMGQAWIINFVVFDLLQIIFAWTLWQSIRSLAPDLDVLLDAASRAERADLLERMLRWHRPRRVVPAMIAGGLFAAGSVAVYTVARTAGIPISPSIFVAIVVTGAIAGHSIYITIFGIWLLRRLLGASRVRVTWQAPINTPGLAGISGVASRTAWLGLVLLILGQPPLIYMFLTARSPVVTIVYAIVFVIHVGLITASGIGAQAWISRRVELEKSRILADLSTKIEEARRDLGAAPERGFRYAGRLVVLTAYVDLHRAIDATANSYLGSATVTQYLASLLAVLLQFGIPVLIRPD